MGIRSLTSYIEHPSRHYLEDYRLHDCNLVIDGSSLCFRLYNWHYAFWKTGYSYDCYGGDYDKYSEIVRGFFEMLQICNVKPYIIFGGRNGINRVEIIKKRLEDKMKAAREITPDDIRNKIKMGRNPRIFDPNQSQAVGVVALKYVFRDVVKELNLARFTCEEDPNREIACLAKHLGCPVLSANSDFFVLGSMFIPFSSFCCQIQTGNNSNWRSTDRKLYQYVPCTIYKIENLLNALNKRPNNNFIPYLIPILLGSDYINQEIFEPFFQSLNIVGGRQEKINRIFDWIRRQTSLEGALKILLDSFHKKEKDAVSQLIQSTVIGYSSVSIEPLLEYFDIGSTPTGSSLTSSELLKKLAECRYPSSFIDMQKENRYFLLANIDDCTKPDANSIGYTIMSAIHNILVQDDKKHLTVFRRNSNGKLEEHVILPIHQMPSIAEIDYLRLESRLDVLLNVVEINQDFCQIFKGIAKEWHLFLLSLKYATSKSELDACFIYSLILCFIILNYVDSNLKGFYRTVRDFENFLRESKDNEISTAPCKINEFPEISAKDSVLLMQKCIKYFEMEEQDNKKTYDRGIVHSIAEFQCVFLHLKHLNNLLDFPVADALIHNTFDSTFIYNMTKTLKNQSDVLKNYMNNFLQDCSTIHSGFFYVVELLGKQSVL